MRMILMVSMIVFLLTGCYRNNIERPPIIKTVEVKVPVVPKLPRLHCEFKGLGLTPLEKLLKCLKLHKQLLEKLKKYEGMSLDKIRIAVQREDINITN